MGLLEKGWGDTRSAAHPTASVFGREEELRIQIEETGRFIRIRSGITHSDTPIPEPEASGGLDTKKGARAWVWPSTRSVQLRPPEIPSPSLSMANTWPPKPRAAGPGRENPSVTSDSRFPRCVLAVRQGQAEAAQGNGALRGDTDIRALLEPGPHLLS